MTGILPAVVKPELESGNLILVVVVALIALGALGMAAMFRSQVIGRRRGHRQHEDHRPGRPGGRQRLPDPAVPHPGRLRRDRVLRAARAAGRRHGRADRPLRLLPGRRGLLRHGRVPRHVARGARQPARRRRRRVRGPRPGHADRLPHRRDGRHADRRARPPRRQRRRAPLQGRGAPRARGLRLRCRAPRHVHASRWRHLHQGCRRRRRPGRQGRAGHPRGRPAQRRDDRRQRGRQRRRLRRHGRRPLRVVRRHAGRRAHPRVAGLR